MLDVDPDSPVPAFEQVRAQLADLIRSGELPAGHRLPPIRQLAGDLGLAPGTVARVYRELESAGLIVSRVRHGTVVAAIDRPSSKQRRAQVDEAAVSLARVVSRQGLALDEALEAVRRAWPDVTAQD